MSKITIVRIAAVFTIVIGLLGCGADKKETFYENGKIQERYFVKEYDGNFLKHGTFTRWYDDGMKAEEIEYVKGKKNGPYTLWYPNGVKKVEGSFVNDNFDDDFTAWYESGQKRLTVQFDEGNREGKWTRYDEKGEVMVTASFNDGKLHGKIIGSLTRGFGGTMPYEFKAKFKKGNPVWERRSRIPEKWAVYNSRS